jgi:peroxiredoxin
MFNFAFSIAILIQVSILVGLVIVIYQVIEQQGRLLLQLDNMDRRLERAGLSAATGAPDEPAGLTIGAPIDPFRLSDLEGRLVSPEHFLGERVLLVYWGPGCGFCELIAPDLARLQGDLGANRIRLVLASREGADSNRRLAAEYGLKCPILLMDADSPLVQGAFRHQGTPAAYLLDGDGRVERPLVVGGDAILVMAREAMGERSKRTRLPGERPLSTSRLVRDGLKAGTPAPTFRLPDLHGETLALDDYRGRRVLLVFTDPHCGPCEELAPQLAKLQDQYQEDGLGLIMVARGDVDENRRKADEYGFEFPVVIQERWDLSREYGIFAVPVAYLIDEEGVIEGGVARGAEEILALVPLGQAAGKT